MTIRKIVNARPPGDKGWGASSPTVEEDDDAHEQRVREGPVLDEHVASCPDHGENQEEHQRAHNAV